MVVIKVILQSSHVLWTETVVFRIYNGEQNSLKTNDILATRSNFTRIERYSVSFTFRSLDKYLRWHCFYLVKCLAQVAMRQGKTSAGRFGSNDRLCDGFRAFFVHLGSDSDDLRLVDTSAQQNITQHTFSEQDESITGNSQGNGTYSIPIIQEERKRKNLTFIGTGQVTQTSRPTNSSLNH